LRRRAAEPPRAVKTASKQGLAAALRRLRRRSIHAPTPSDELLDLRIKLIPITMRMVRPAGEPIAAGPRAAFATITVERLTPIVGGNNNFKRIKFFYSQA
jgi:hypothetical protein